jgi:hypothetical protein
MIFLETKRLLFRSHQVGDEEEFIRMHTDAELFETHAGEIRVSNSG